jgi:hypothetical protein
MGSKIDFVLDVEYCVYAPGGFGSSYPGQDPSGGARYVFAYRVLNNLDPYPYPPEELDGGVKGSVNTLSVGLTDGDECASDITYVADGGNAPSSMSINPSSAMWNFVGAAYQIDYGETSEILIFTSPVVPSWDNASVSGEWSDTQQLPSPAPEPASLVLLAAGAAICVSRRRRLR